MKKSIESIIKTLIVSFIVSEMILDDQNEEGDTVIDNVVENEGSKLYEEIIDLFKAQIVMVTLVGDSCTINIPNRLIYSAHDIKIFMENPYRATPTYTLLDIIAL